MDYAVILAGGAGTRLWPLSRVGVPKQLLTLFAGRSLLQSAYERALTLVDPDRVLVCAGRIHEQATRDQLPDLGVSNYLAEPIGRDSLAAIAWSVATLAERDPQAVVTVLTADHLIDPLTAFTATLREAAALAAQKQRLVTCGILPTQPHTGYGYIQLGEALPENPQAFQVRQFAEKPRLDLATRYLAEGNWWWNSGMFVWRADSFLTELARLKPQFAAKIDQLVKHPDLIDEIYPDLEAISVDYAILEPVCTPDSPAEVVTLGLEAEWIDVGAFPILAGLRAPGEANWVDGTVIAANSTGNLIINRRDDGHLVAVSGLNDTIVVVVDDVTLVCPMSQAESIKQLVDLAREQSEGYV
ncbi:MAG: mannose-1-phosphate guanylyltransferase [Propionibacteriaceae bacterium]|jgi:mannose-1-phosphate guanylyltransferase|nr:mannose-1-phosphate guanylyltransferase [Propionibacteriaceae bacterium]